MRSLRYGSVKQATPWTRTCNVNLMAVRGMKKTNYGFPSPKFDKLGTKAPQGPKAVIIGLEENKEIMKQQALDPLLTPLIPLPTDGMDVKTFLTKIGRGCEEHIEAFESFEELFYSTTKSMRKKRDSCEAS